MDNLRVKELLDYLNVLSQVQGSGHYVNEEIKEVVKEIRIELGLEKRKQDTLKASRKLVFEAKLGGKTTFLQDILFEAAFGRGERQVEFLVGREKLHEIEAGIEAIKNMKAPIVSAIVERKVDGSHVVRVERK